MTEPVIRTGNRNMSGSSDVGTSKMESFCFWYLEAALLVCDGSFYPAVRPFRGTGLGSGCSSYVTTLVNTASRRHM